MLERNQASHAGLPSRYARRETLLRSARIKINSELKSKKSGGRADCRFAIADCGFPIGLFRYGLMGNRQWQIGNRITLMADDRIQ